MPRPPDTARRAEIAAHAFEVLRARGLRRTSMSEIAAALGMKRPTLYWYFKDTAEIFEAVLEQTLARAATHVAERVAAVEHPLDALDAFLRAVHEFHAGHERFLVGMMQLWAAGDPAHPERFIDRSRAQVELFRAYAVERVEAGIRAGLVAPVDAGALVDAVRAISDGLLVGSISREVNAGAVIDLVRERLLEPLRRRPAREGPAAGIASGKGTRRRSKG